MKRDPEPPTPGLDIAANDGKMTRRDPADRHALWNIKWEKAEISYTDDERFSGKMQVVSGELFEDDKVVSTYTADRGLVIKEDDRLELIGNVNVIGLDPKGTMRCDRLIWHAKEQRIEASGNVTVSAGGFTSGPFVRLFCNPDLTQIATPDVYQDNR